MGSSPLIDYYNSSYHNIRHKNLLNDDKYFWARSRVSVEMYFSEYVADEPKILEFGVGIGQNIALLKNAAGYDISKEALDACRMRNIEVYESLESIPKDYFDIVLSRHSLEHVPNPLDSLIQMRSNLKEGGKLILILPKQHHGKAGFETDINNHLFCWNFRTINNLLIQAGFKPFFNKNNYALGYKLLLPIYKIFGYRMYYIAVKIFGRISMEDGELIIHATRVD